ncbi:MAG TPA: aminotransferase class IV [bacterium]|nr:aminotransferase class IV [bacterium]
MIGSHIIKNGRIAEAADAVFPLDDTDVTYGYGCYETLKVRRGVIYFPEFHEERLLRSADILGIATIIRPPEVADALRLLVRENAMGDCNIKVMLIGHEGAMADWYAFMLPALVAPETAYSEGASCLLFRGERHFPQAKSLSMLLSTVAFREAARQGCWDALLVNGRGQITEGTRTNVFYARSGESFTIYTPPAVDVLEGITRRTLIVALAEADISTVERPLELAEAVSGEYSLAVTSTSSKVIPIAMLAAASSMAPGLPSEPIRLPLCREIERVRALYDDYLARWVTRRR